MGPSSSSPLPSVDIYDTGDEELGPIFETLLEQAAPFFEELEVEPASELEPALPIFTPPPLPLPVPPPIVADPLHRFVRAGFDERLARDVIDEARSEHGLFAPNEHIVEHLVAALARRIRVARPARRRQRIVTVVGGPGSGKTLTAARLCHAYATNGAVGRVAALSLGSVREAVELVGKTKDLNIEIAAASGRRELRLELAKLQEAELIIVDTPAVSTRTEMRKLANLLELVEPDETHLLLPASLNADAVEALLEDAQPMLAPDRLLLTQLDRPGGVAAAVSASLKHRLPISFCSTGEAWGLRPAEPRALAELVLA